MRSQRPSVAAPPKDAPDRDGDDTLLFQSWIHQMKRPATGYLRLDTTQSVDACVRDAIAFIEG